MPSIRVCLCSALLSVSVLGYNFSSNGWTISGADELSAMEGANAVLPCTFTHPPTDRILTGSVLWHKRKSGVESVVFNCTYPGPGRSLCDEVTQEAGGSRCRFVGNLRQRDVSIMVGRLSREDDGATFRCQVDLNIGSFHTVVPTRLTVISSGENVSVVTGTEGASATLSCVFPPPPLKHAPLAVTWMRKDPYRHIVTFRPQADGSWAAENGATRFELVGNPERGNASTWIKQLRVDDSHDYLCLVPIRKPEAKYLYILYPPFIHQYQRELRLRVTPVTQVAPIVILCIPLGLKTFALLVMSFIYCSAKLRYVTLCIPFPLSNREPVCAFSLVPFKIQCGNRPVE
ncbi:uncharacterized protein LOC129715273 isoform X2 [Leucoraja erinacea]|uniref:uncharacterized protein LOC129715273 isoform X2 n=1 Tax=Leucoraja erinaceus TaxID=7782 RepID=UPI0024581669|nr:uncharacterized protein LOC129715273 isoform X2 [Leucoraja erinacea]